jgi:shikimate kinase
MKQLALIGPMGAGKTTIGKALAKRLGLVFVDSDHEIEVRTGVTVANIFAVEGEAGFRTREMHMIDELSQRTGVVLATGGGAVLFAENRQVLQSRCTVIYLRASPEDVFERIAQDKARPLLQTADPLATLRALFAVRDPLYLQTAHITIETRHKRCTATVEAILAQLPVPGSIPAAD